MNAITAIAKRDVLSYFRDRQSVFFSLMGVLIVVLLYLLFLRNMLVEAYPDMDGMGNLIDAWVLSGILGIVPVTTCAGALQTMVDDRVNGRDHDILVTPVRPMHIAAGHVLSTFIVGLLMSYILLALCIAYLVATGCPLSPTGTAVSAVLVVPSALSASIIMYALVSFIKSSGAFSGLFTVVSVLIGFLAGIYMPMGTMPSMMQTIGTLVPASHMAALFRDTMASEALNDVFAGAPSDVLTDFRNEMGFDLHLGGYTFDAATMIAYVLAVTAVFFAVSALAVKRKRRDARFIQAPPLTDHAQIRSRLLRHGRNAHHRTQLLEMDP